MSTVLAWRVRIVRGGQDAERFLVQFLEGKVGLSEEVWEGDGVERDEAQVWTYAALLDVSVDAFRYGIEQARAEFTGRRNA